MNYETHKAHDLPTDKCAEYLCSGVTSPVEAADVTDEMIDMVESIADGHFDSRIDWEMVWDYYLDGSILNDGTKLYLGDEYDTRAMRKIKREVLKRRRES